MAAVLNSRLSMSKVKALVEFLFVTEYYTVSEKIACALRRKCNPACTVEQIGPSHEPLISCGHGLDRMLVARLVDDLTVESGPTGKDRLVTWKTCLGGKVKSVMLTEGGIHARMPSDATFETSWLRSLGTRPA